MVSIRQDIDTLKQASSLQGGNNSTTPDPGSVGRPSELGPRLSIPDDNNTEPVYLLPDRIPGTTWAEEMEIWQDRTPTEAAPMIQVVPVFKQTNQFLDQAFSVELHLNDQKKAHKSILAITEWANKDAIPGRHDG